MHQLQQTLLETGRKGHVRLQARTPLFAAGSLLEGSRRSQRFAGVAFVATVTLHSLQA